MQVTLQFTANSPEDFVRLQDLVLAYYAGATSGPPATQEDTSGPGAPPAVESPSPGQGDTSSDTLDGAMIEQATARAMELIKAKKRQKVIDALEKAGVSKVVNIKTPEQLKIFMEALDG